MNHDSTVSIIVPTFNRRERLVRCVEKVRANVSLNECARCGATGPSRDRKGALTTVPSRDREGAVTATMPRCVFSHGHLDYELIVVDGGSTDGSRDWLQSQPDLTTILEPQREGAVRAFNKGFRAARGEYIMWLNDDAYPLAGSVEAAVAMIRRPDLPNLGMVAFYHNWHQPRNLLHEVERDGRTYGLFHVRGYPYANFGLTRTDTMRRVDYFDERYYFFAADPDFSLKLQIDEGLEVIGCPDALIHHDEDHDERKLSDLSPGAQDNAALFAKWSLPDRSTIPNPAPAYQRMIRERGIVASPAAVTR